VKGAAAPGGRLQDASKQPLKKKKMSYSLFYDFTEITLVLSYRRVGKKLTGPRLKGEIVRENPGNPPKVNRF
jgi:hypothetical protein